MYSVNVHNMMEQVIDIVIRYLFHKMSRQRNYSMGKNEVSFREMNIYFIRMRHIIYFPSLIKNVKNIRSRVIRKTKIAQTFEILNNKTDNELVWGCRSTSNTPI